MSSEIKCVIFDVGNVLTSERIDAVFDEFNVLLGKKVFNRKSKLHRQYLSGKITEIQYYATLAKKAKTSREKLRKLAINKYKEIIKPRKNVLLLARLLKKKGYKISIISNISPDHKRIKKSLGLFKDFFPVILSCDVGCIKPQKRIFQLGIKKTGLKPEEIVYTDDRKEFLDMPKKLGMHTIHFKNATQLKFDLRKMGVKL